MLKKRLFGFVQRKEINFFLKVRKNLRERQPRRRIHSSPSFRKDETAMEKLQPGMMDDVRKLFNQFDKDRSGIYFFMFVFSFISFFFGTQKDVPSSV